MSDNVMKVLLVGPLPPPYGGQSVLVRDILESAVNRTWPLIPFDVAHDNPGTLKRVLLSLLFALRLSWRLVTSPSIRLLHVHSSAGIALFEKSVFVLIGRLFGKRVLLHLHGGRLRESWESASGPARRLLAWLVERNHALIVLGPASRDYLQLRMGCRAAIHVLPNAVRIEAASPLVSPEPSGTGAGKKVVFLYVGHLKARKGLLDLWDALGLLPEEVSSRCEVRVMGAGDTPGNEREVLAAFRSAGLGNVTFLGVRTGADKWAEFAAADVFLLPSHSEDLPLTVLEAMGSGLPVLATAVGAVPDVVTDGENGFLVPVAAPALLAERMATLVLHPELRELFGRANREKYLERYSFSRYEERLAEIYAQLMF